MALALVFFMRWRTGGGDGSLSLSLKEGCCMFCLLCTVLVAHYLWDHPPGLAQESERSFGAGTWEKSLKGCPAASIPGSPRVKKGCAPESEKSPRKSSKLRGL